MQSLGYDCEYVNVSDYVDKIKPEGTKVVGVKGNETKCFNTIYQISFMCDGILRIGGNYYILEIKTENSFKFSSRFGVDEKHHNQAICYSLLLNIDNVIFLYENRDTCKKKTYMFTVTVPQKKDIVDKIAGVEQSIKEKTLPERCSDARVCQYCEYTKKCKMEAYE